MMWYKEQRIESDQTTLIIRPLGCMYQCSILKKIRDSIYSSGRQGAAEYRQPQTCFTVLKVNDLLVTFVLDSRESNIVNCRLDRSGGEFFVFVFLFFVFCFLPSEGR